MNRYFGLRNKLTAVDIALWVVVAVVGFLSVTAVTWMILEIVWP